MKKILRNNLRQKKGSILVETISVMLLLVLLGVCSLSLAMSSFGAYQRLDNSRAKSSELRIASSFIINKIRQNDMSGNIDVRPDTISGNNALVIYESINGENYATWIYHDSGCLMEALVLRHEVPSPDVSKVIAKVDSFSLDFDREKRQITFSVGIEGVRPYNSVIKIRSR
ncbi:MAG: DUF4860 domain-containing protein [Clostridiaceae bacterium]|nr:DUF4860 domain-containing protein [Clostridiaceae bacterium]